MLCEISMCNWRFASFSTFSIPTIQGGQRQHVHRVPAMSCCHSLPSCKLFTEFFDTASLKSTASLFRASANWSPGGPLTTPYTSEFFLDDMFAHSKRFHTCSRDIHGMWLRIIALKGITIGVTVKTTRML